VQKQGIRLPPKAIRIRDDLVKPDEFEIVFADKMSDFVK
jgi:hypothetical protein